MTQSSPSKHPKPTSPTGQSISKKRKVSWSGEDKIELFNKESSPDTVGGSMDSSARTLSSLSPKEKSTIASFASVRQSTEASDPLFSPTIVDRFRSGDKTDATPIEQRHFAVVKLDVKTDVQDYGEDEEMKDISGGGQDGPDGDEDHIDSDSDSEDDNDEHEDGPTEQRSINDEEFEALDGDAKIKHLEGILRRFDEDKAAHLAEVRERRTQRRVPQTDPDSLTSFPSFKPASRKAAQAKQSPNPPSAIKVGAPPGLAPAPSPATTSTEELQKQIKTLKRQIRDLTNRLHVLRTADRENHRIMEAQSEEIKRLSGCEETLQWK